VDRRSILVKKRKRLFAATIIHRISSVEETEARKHTRRHRNGQEMRGDLTAMTDMIAERLITAVFSSNLQVHKKRRMISITD